MGHLGNSTPITTVQDKEVLLTDSKGQNFKIKLSNLAEAVRQVMPVATSDKNGLMSISDRNKLRDIDVSQDSSKAINIGKVNGIFRFRVWSTTHEMSAYLISSFEPSVSYMGGINIASIGYSFSFNSSKELILVDEIEGRITHVAGMAEYIV